MTTNQNEGGELAARWEEARASRVTTVSETIKAMCSLASIAQGSAIPSGQRRLAPINAEPTEREKLVSSIKALTEQLLAINAEKCPFIATPEPPKTTP